MDAHARLVDRVAGEQDDLLCTLQLVGNDDALRDHMFEQLVDLLVEGMFLGLRSRYLSGELTRDEYVEDLASLAEQCRDVGLLPLPSRER